MNKSPIHIKGISIYAWTGNAGTVVCIFGLLLALGFIRDYLNILISIIGPLFYILLWRKGDPETVRLDRDEISGGLGVLSYLTAIITIICAILMSSSELPIVQLSAIRMIIIIGSIMIMLRFILNSIHSYVVEFLNDRKETLH